MKNKNKLESYKTRTTKVAQRGCEILQFILLMLTVFLLDEQFLKIEELKYTIIFKFVLTN